MAKYCKKSAVFDAMCVYPSVTAEELEAFAGTMISPFNYRDGKVFIVTLEGETLVNYGDWIIKGKFDEIDLCKPEIFEASYRVVTTSESLP